MRTASALHAEAQAIGFGLGVDSVCATVTSTDFCPGVATAFGG
jgi:hypothetical protein